MKLLFTKIFLTIVLSVVTLAALFAPGRLVHSKIHSPKPAFHASPVTFQRQITHALRYVDKEGNPIGFCTAMAAGPHALMTAQHCDDDGGSKTDTIELDLSFHKYTILAAATDDRDHIIYLLDGPALEVFPSVEQMKPQSVWLGEELFMYGCAGGIFPCRSLTGRVDTEAMKNDPSDVDRKTGMVYAHLAVEEGDSGSPIFRHDGSLVGLASWSYDDNQYSNLKDVVFFPLNFSPEALENAHNFSIEDIERILASKKKK